MVQVLELDCYGSSLQAFEMLFRYNGVK